MTSIVFPDDAEVVASVRARLPDPGVDVTVVPNPGVPYSSDRYVRVDMRHDGSTIRLHAPAHPDGYGGLDVDQVMRFLQSDAQALIAGVLPPRLDQIEETTAVLTKAFGTPLPDPVVMQEGTSSHRAFQLCYPVEGHDEYDRPGTVLVRASPFGVEGPNPEGFKAAKALLTKLRRRRGRAALPMDVRYEVESTVLPVAREIGVTPTQLVETLCDIRRPAYWPGVIFELREGRLSVNRYVMPDTAGFRGREVTLRTALPESMATALAGRPLRELAAGTVFDAEPIESVKTAGRKTVVRLAVRLLTLKDADQEYHRNAKGERTCPNS